MTPTELCRALDAHDALVRDCVEGRLTFAEFLGAYADFPKWQPQQDSPTKTPEREAAQLLRRRVAFHAKVAALVSALRRPADPVSMESTVADFLPAVALMRLKDLTRRYPAFEVEST